MCTLSVATTDVRTDRDGNKQETTEWHRGVVWSKQAENCAKYLAKGRKVFIEGRIQTRSWDDQQTGQKRYSTEIVAQNVQFIGGNARGDGAPMQQGGGYSPPPSGGGMNQHSDMGAPSTPSLDDIPF